ncbi:MAG: glycoside hydrolase family 2 TIM barrel-domain containing protein [Clostridia bacterium]
MARNTIRLKNGWKFQRGIIENAQEIGFDDNAWREVTVPHDWAVEGPFNVENDKQVTTVIADGIIVPMTHEGRTGGLPISGESWYRIKIQKAQANKKYALRFDAAMNRSEIFVNGTYVGGRPYGYSSFCLDITEQMSAEEENVVAVKLAPKDFSSRWYPGAGLFRNVYLIETDMISVAYNGTYVTSRVIDNEAYVDIRCEIENKSDAEKIIVIKNVITKNGKEIAQSKDLWAVKDKSEYMTTMQFENPVLWDMDSPELYKLYTYIMQNDEVVDDYETSFGIRTIRFDNNKGFFLNDKHVKLKGVCMHHDLGALGAAVNKFATYRQMKIMKEMGCNSIRTSHNPPSIELLDICDELGLLVLDEAFDEWRVPKTDNGYAGFFEEWATKDLGDMVKRDRNHPCIIMWSLGNEILDQAVPEGGATARLLSDTCHRLDPTRPTTCGFNNPDGAFKNGLAANIDIVGVNYKPHRYAEFHKKYPDWIFYGSETESCVSSRGEYYFPAEPRFFKSDEPNIVIEGRNHVNSFDMEGPQWAYSPEREFAAQDDFEFMLGEYVWTGFDYLGEPTPFRNHWPSHASYFGIVDRAGIPKDRYYSYKAKWSDEEVLHIFPHWNWNDLDNKEIEVHCYASEKFECIELFVNGKSYGIKGRKQQNEYERYRFIFKNVEFEEGQVKAVAYDKNGIVLKVATICTAGEPYRIELEPERKIINADGEDLCYIKVSVVDKNGVLCPKATNKINFIVSGEGKYIAADDGDQTSLRTFSKPYCNAFNGMCMAIVSSTEDAGEITVYATSNGLKNAKTQIISK